MGIFSNSTPFDQIVEKVTDEKSGEDWGLIMEVCDRVGATTTGPKDCLKSIIKRLQHQDPHVVLQALTLLDACVNNCGQYFMLEVASRDFESEYRKLLVKVHPKVQERMLGLVKTWSEGEFSKDAKYSLIPSLYANLKREGHSFGGSEVKRSVPKDPNVVSSNQEEDDIAKAIQLSLQENKHSELSQPVSSVLYPTDSLHSSGGAVGGSTVGVPNKKEKKARCLYDFEAAEDNELTFKSGEVLLVLDDEDPNWWKGSNHRGEGLFPANFVTLDLDSETGERRKSVQFNEEVEVKEVEQITFAPQLTIDEGKIDQLLGILLEADPLEEDPGFLPQMEDQVRSMGPLIDTELERIDRQHAKLTRLSHELVDALSLYHTLMRDMPALPFPPYSMPSMPGYMPAMGHGMPMPGMPPTSMPGMPPGVMPMHHGMPHGNMQPASMPGGMPPSGMPGGMPSTGMPGGMPLSSMPGGMPPSSMPGGMPAANMSGGMPSGMPGGGMPHMGMPPQMGGPGMPGYYMDPGMQGGYMNTPPQGYGGSAPPPTPPLFDPAHSQEQQQNNMATPIYSANQ